jgi:hypothetical protein
MPLSSTIFLIASQTGLMIPAPPTALTACSRPERGNCGRANARSTSESPEIIASAKELTK